MSRCPAITSFSRWRSVAGRSATGGLSRWEQVVEREHGPGRILEDREASHAGKVLGRNEDRGAERAGALDDGIDPRDVDVLDPREPTVEPDPRRHQATGVDIAGAEDLIGPGRAQIDAPAASPAEQLAIE